MRAGLSNPAMINRRKWGAAKWRRCVDIGPARKPTGLWTMSMSLERGRFRGHKEVEVVRG